MVYKRAQLTYSHHCIQYLEIVLNSTLSLHVLIATMSTLWKGDYYKLNFESDYYFLYL